MKLLGSLGLLSLAFALCATPALAHGGCHHGHGYHDCDGCWGSGCESCAQQAPSALRSQTAPRTPASATARPTANFETVEGRIAEVIYLPGVNPTDGMVEMQVASGEQQTLVRLAPAGFLERHTALLKEGETVSLTGYRVHTADGDVIVATELRNGDQTLRLRNSRGRGLW